ncbi:hypothetical protein EVAR_23588_1 [Eumeta japonica]|uniref:Uncharacterized protein n=1 Tax=Eumeta variegata TaxID=151549 RepID=A0A4C1X1A5_EUMVA|nr:hypothetical protein EVAR_23588_1 [Eumeta japonica]
MKALDLVLLLNWVQVRHPVTEPVDRLSPSSAEQIRFQLAVCDCCPFVNLFGSDVYNIFEEQKSWRAIRLNGHRLPWTLVIPEKSQVHFRPLGRNGISNRG